MTGPQSSLRLGIRHTASGSHLPMEETDLPLSGRTIRASSPFVHPIPQAPRRPRQDSFRVPFMRDLRKLHDLGALDSGVDPAPVASGIFSARNVATSCG